MTRVTVEEAQARLPVLIDMLQPGEELVITRNDQAVARLVGERSGGQRPRQPGHCRGMLTIVAEDAEHLEDFAEFLPTP